MTSLYTARRRDPAFAAEWIGALAASADAERDARAAPAGGETVIRPGRRRFYQKHKLRAVRFDEARRLLFLQHFAQTCDARAAATAAGVTESTVDLHRRTDPQFATLYQETLEGAYDRLEAELLRERLAAQARLRAALEAGPAPAVAAGAAEEFERAVKLLDRRDRKARLPRTNGGRREHWTFDNAIALLDARLKALGVEVEPLPPDEAAAWDGEEAPGPDEAP